MSRRIEVLERIATHAKAFEDAIASAPSVIVAPGAMLAFEAMRDALEEYEACDKDEPIAYPPERSAESFIIDSFARVARNLEDRRAQPLVKRLLDRWRKATATRVGRVFDLGRVQGRVIIDYRKGMVQRATLTGPIKLVFLPNHPVLGRPAGSWLSGDYGSFLLDFIQDAVGGHTIEWEKTVRWNENHPYWNDTHPPGPGFRQMFVVHVLPFGLCAEWPTLFTPEGQP